MSHTNVCQNKLLGIEHRLQVSSTRQSSCRPQVWDMVARYGVNGTMAMAVAERLRLSHGVILKVEVTLNWFNVPWRFEM